jgi:MarR family transcriptional regulator, temperature-dependent positive regulator of motility
MLRHQLQMFELSNLHYRILEALAGGSPMSQAALAAKVFSHGSSVHLAVKLLRERGLVIRRAQARDRRSVAVGLTDEGRKLAEEISPVQARIVRAKMLALTWREQETVARLCRKLREGDAVKFLKEMTMID